MRLSKLGRPIGRLSLWTFITFLSRAGAYALWIGVNVDLRGFLSLISANWIRTWSRDDEIAPVIVESPPGWPSLIHLSEGMSSTPVGVGSTSFSDAVLAQMRRQPSMGGSSARG